MRGSHSAEQGSIAASPHGCEVGGLDAWCLVTDAEDSPVDAMQDAALHALLDLLGRDAGALQLRSRYNPV